MKKFAYSLLAVLMTLAAFPVAAMADGGEGGRKFADFFDKLLKPLGLATAALLVITFFFGLYMKKNRKLLFKWHKRLAYVTIIVAIIHGVLVIYVN